MTRFALLVIALVGACGNHGPQGPDAPNNGGGGGARLKSNLDLTGVMGFAIAKGTAARGLGTAPADPCMPSTLYAVQDNGDMVVTTVTETAGMDDAGSMCNTTSSTEMATAVHNLKKYVIIDYGGTGLSVTNPAGPDMPLNCLFVVLRKSDGALFCGPQLPGIGSGTVWKGDGDVLYLGPNTLAKLDMAMVPPQATVINDPGTTGQSIGDFEVDGANNVLAGGGFGLRIYKQTGGILGITTMQNTSQWVNPATGDFYYSFGAPASATPPEVGIVTKRLTQGTYAQTLVGAYNGGFGTVQYGLAVVTATQAYRWESDGAGKSGIIDMLPSAAGQVCRGVGPPFTTCTSDADCTGTCVAGSPPRCTGGSRDGMACDDPMTGMPSQARCTDTCALGGAQHPLTGVYSVQSALGSGTSMFLLGADNAGNSFIDSVDTGAIGEAACSTTGCSTFNGGCCSSAIDPTTLLAAGDYSITAISPSGAGELSFYGVRFSDGASVVGTCTATTCTVLSANAPAVQSLVRIN